MIFILCVFQIWIVAMHGYVFVRHSCQLKQISKVSELFKNMLCMLWVIRIHMIKKENLPSQNFCK